MKRRSFPYAAAVLFLVAVLPAAPFFGTIPPAGAQSAGEMVDVYDPYDQDSGDTPLEEPEPWEADEYTEEWNDETAAEPDPEEGIQRPETVEPEEVPLREEVAEDDWTELYEDIYDDPEGIYEGFEDEPLETYDQPYDDEPADAYDDAIESYD
jgi:hypothetical protein